MVYRQVLVPGEPSASAAAARQARHGELLNLRWTDIDLDAKEITATRLTALIGGRRCLRAAPPVAGLQTFTRLDRPNDELAGTPTTVGTYTFTMRLSDSSGQQATQKFTLTIDH